MEKNDIRLLIIRYLNGSSSEAENAELLHWLDADSRNLREFRTLKDAYDLGQFEFNVKTADTAAQWQKLSRAIKTPTVRSSTRMLRWMTAGIMRYAAVFVTAAVLFGISGYLTGRFSGPDQPTRIETGVGERTRITLPDNSIVWLNSCSSLSYNMNFGKKNRDIELSGEAFFNVRKDAGTPFRVRSGEITYRVTGTSFNVYAFEDDDTEMLALVEGSVALEYGQALLTVKPGEVVEFNKTRKRFLVKHSDPDSYTSWRFGELVFEKMSFEELSRRLERNFNIKFVFRNEQVKRESFGGSFHNYDTLETILKVIGTSTPIKYRIEQDTVYIE